MLVKDLVMLSNSGSYFVVDGLIFDNLDIIKYYGSRIVKMFWALDINHIGLKLEN